MLSTWLILEELLESFEISHLNVYVVISFTEWWEGTFLCYMWVKWMNQELNKCLCVVKVSVSTCVCETLNFLYLFYVWDIDVTSVKWKKGNQYSSLYATTSQFRNLGKRFLKCTIRNYVIFEFEMATF